MPEAAAQRAQQRIAGGPTQAFVDLREVIDVAHQHRQRMFAAPRAQQLAAQRVDAEAAVVQARQRIAQRVFVGQLARLAQSILEFLDACMQLAIGLPHLFAHFVRRRVPVPVGGRPRMRERVAHRIDQRLALYRFADEMRHAAGIGELARLGFEKAGAGYHHAGMRQRRFGGDAPRELEAIDARQHHVGEQQIGLDIFQQHPRLVAASRLHHPIPGFAQEGGHVFAVGGVVGGDENRGHCGSLSNSGLRANLYCGVGPWGESSGPARVHAIRGHRNAAAKCLRQVSGKPFDTSGQAQGKPEIQRLSDTRPTRTARRTSPGTSWMSSRSISCARCVSTVFTLTVRR